jgi:hypothetical protein
LRPGAVDLRVLRRADHGAAVAVADQHGALKVFEVEQADHVGDAGFDALHRSREVRALGESRERQRVDGMAELTGRA